MVELERPVAAAENDAAEKEPRHGGREYPWPRGVSSPRIVAPPLVQKLRACHDRFDEAAEAIAVCRQALPHGVQRRPIRQLQAASQRVREELTAQVVEKVLLPFVAQVGTQSVQSFPIFAVGE